MREFKHCEFIQAVDHYRNYDVNSIIRTVLLYPVLSIHRVQGSGNFELACWNGYGNVHTTVYNRHYNYWITVDL